MRIHSPAKALAIITLALIGATAPAANAQGISWPEDQALPTFAEPRALDVADIRELDGDLKLLLGTLQGVINRTEPRIYLIGDDAPIEGPQTWLETLGVPYTLEPDPLALVERYADEIAGTIVFDPDVPDSINVATTMAGLEDAIVASPDLAEALAEDYGLEILEDLRGRFTDRLDAYEWQFENLWSQTTHRMLVGLPPTRGVGIPPDLPDHYTVLADVEEHIHDASNRETLELDLSEHLGGEGIWLRFDDVFTGDGWGPAVGQVLVHADGEPIADFIPGTAEEEPFLYDGTGSQIGTNQPQHRFADGNARFVYQFDPPPGTEELTVRVQVWNEYRISVSSVQPARPYATGYAYLRDYAVANRAMVFWLDPNVPGERALFERIMSETEPPTPYLGWFAQDVAGEFAGTELVSSHGVYVVPADWFENMSVHSGVRAPISKSQRSLTAPPLENKVYVTFVMSEGDNLQYNEHRMRQLWDDPQRGDVPINWSASPLLADAAPGILSHYQRTATANDLLIAGPSGAGYIYPAPWPADQFDVYAAQTRSYMRATGMDIVYVLNRVDHSDVPLPPDKASAYAEQIKPRGMFIHWGGTTETQLLGDALPLATVRGASGRQEVQSAIEDAAAGWDGESPLFLTIGVLAWGTTPTHLAEVADALGPEFEIVRADQYFKLVRQAHGIATPKLKVRANPRKLRIAPKRKRVRLALRVANDGDMPSGRVRLCAKAPRKRMRIAGKRCVAREIADAAAVRHRFTLRPRPAARGKLTRVKLIARGPRAGKQHAIVRLRVRR